MRRSFDILAHAWNRLCSKLRNPSNSPAHFSTQSLYEFHPWQTADEPLSRGGHGHLPDPLALSGLRGLPMPPAFTIAARFRGSSLFRVGSVSRLDGFGEGQRAAPAPDDNRGVVQSARQPPDCHQCALNSCANALSTLAPMRSQLLRQCALNSCAKGLSTLAPMRSQLLRQGAVEPGKESTGASEPARTQATLWRTGPDGRQFPRLVGRTRAARLSDESGG